MVLSQWANMGIQASSRVDGLNGGTMEKKQQKTKQPGSSLALRKETLRQFGDSELRGAAGGARMWKPAGFADDTTPIYEEVDI